MEKKKMSGKFRCKIRLESEKLCKSIPEHIRSGEREVEEDKRISSVCEKYGYELSDFYASDEKFCKLNY